MKLFDIYDAQVLWAGCPDRRPWIIVEAPTSGRAGCFPISGQDYQGTHFFISSNDPDFPATGLKKSCYIHDDQIIHIPVNLFIKWRGYLQGALLASFRKQSGI